VFGACASEPHELGDDHRHAHQRHREPDCAPRQQVPCGAIRNSLLVTDAPR